MNRVIVRKKHTDRLSIYKRSFKTAAVKAINNETAFNQVILYGVRMVAGDKTEAVTHEDAQHKFKLADSIMQLITFTTPRKLVSIFPIEKEYNGKKWGSKDYFSTIESINKHGWDEQINEPFDFLWDYMNWEITMFVVNYMSLISELRRFRGEPGLMETWAKDNNVPIYSMYTTEDGKQYLVDESGKAKRVKRSAKHLRLVINNK